MIYTVRSTDDAIEWGLKGDDRIIQNVLNLIRTRIYEVPFMRHMGIDPDIIDNAMVYINQAITSDIIDLIEEYENRVTVLDLKINTIDNDGNVEIVVKLEV